MSFADELRQAPDKKKREEERQQQLRVEQQKEDLKRLASEWDKYIRNVCKQVAADGKTSHSFGLRQFIEQMEETFKSDHRTQDWWERISTRIRCKLHPKNEYAEVCLNEKDIESLESTIKRYLEMDGLSVTTQRKEHQTYKIEYVYVKRSTSSKVATGLFNILFSPDEFDIDDDGEYKPRKVADEVRYGLIVSVSW